MIKTKLIVAPFQANPNKWTKRVVWLHNQLVQDPMLVQSAVISTHANILAGAYGNDLDSTERKNGMRNTLALVQATALGYKNELYVITFDNGTISDGVEKELQTWVDIRSDLDLDLNMYAGTWQHWLDEFKQ